MQPKVVDLPLRKPTVRAIHNDLLRNRKYPCLAPSTSSTYCTSRRVKTTPEPGARFLPAPASSRVRLVSRTYTGGVSGLVSPSQTQPTIGPSSELGGCGKKSKLFENRQEWSQRSRRSQQLPLFKLFFIEKLFKRSLQRCASVSDLGLEKMNLY